MAVYVDKIQPCLRTKKWLHEESCHLIADTEQELHEFAVKIKLRRNWYQGNHYLLTVPKRKKAVKNGAIELEDMMEFLRIVRRMVE